MFVRPLRVESRLPVSASQTIVSVSKPAGGDSFSVFAEADESIALREKSAAVRHFQRRQLTQRRDVPELYRVVFREREQTAIATELHLALNSFVVGRKLAGLFLRSGSRV